ncbi:flagellar biosynthesis protein FlgA [Plantactinospora sp. CA-290183]|uniref:flagellar biosynthesis protein FlgA n=1 Tax=Plantactinospora sp. CA-290183 TaxID=3240006 RepID=UPI003D8D05A6
MALDRTLSRRDDPLRPSRWPSRPAGGPLLRWALVAALLLLAGGILYLSQPQVSCSDGRAGAVRPASSTAPTATGVAGPATPARPSSAGPGTSSGPHGGASSGPDGGRGGALPLPAGAVGVPIRLAEPAALAVVRPGIRVDLLAVPADDRSARSTAPTLVAGRALVLDVLDQAADDAVAGALYLALAPEQARRAVGMPAPTRFAIIVRP